MPPKFRVLVLAERGDQHEAFVVAALAWLKSRSSAEHFQFDIFEAPVGFDNQLLAKYQVFIQLNYPPYRWSDEAQAAFVDYIEQRARRLGRTSSRHVAGRVRRISHVALVFGIHGRHSVQELHRLKRVSGNVNVEARSHPCFKGLPAKASSLLRSGGHVRQESASECARAGERG